MPLVALCHVEAVSGFAAPTGFLAAGLFLSEGLYLANTMTLYSMLLAAALLLPGAAHAQAGTAPQRSDAREAAATRVQALRDPSRSTKRRSHPVAQRNAQGAAARTPVAARGPAARVPRSAAVRSAALDQPMARKAVLAARAIEPARLSVGQSTGLHNTDDPLDLHSAVAYVVDQRTGEVLLAKNPDAVLPIASITKVMTSLVVLDAAQPLTELLEISSDDIDTEKGSRSRLRPGTRLSRAELLQLALMASENRAAHALGRHFEGGLPAFVAAMNEKARQLGMAASRFSDPTGLSERNVSNARDLAKMLKAAYDYPLIRQYSTAPALAVDGGRHAIGFRNTNRLIEHSAWSIGLQKTGYIAEAGRCLVMQATLESRPVLMVLLDSAGKYSRFGDAQRIRDWLDADHRRPGLTRVRQSAVVPAQAVPAMVATRY